MNGQNSNTSGAAVVKTDFAAKHGSDVISDERMEEIARRLILTLEATNAGNVVFTVTPPTDHSKVWWPIDSASGLPIGSPKVWDSEAQQWVSVKPSSDQYIPPKQRKMTYVADEGQSQKTLNFENIGTTDYRVTITPTSFIGGTWQAAPGTFPTHFGWIVTNKGEAEITINFFGTPAGGANFEIDIEERI